MFNGLAFSFSSFSKQLRFSSTAYRTWNRQESKAAFVGVNKRHCSRALRAQTVVLIRINFMHTNTSTPFPPLHTTWASIVPPKPPPFCFTPFHPFPFAPKHSLPSPKPTSVLFLAQNFLCSEFLCCSDEQRIDATEDAWPARCRSDSLSFAGKPRRQDSHQESKSDSASVGRTL